MRELYEIREEDDGTWSVFHIELGFPIAIGEVRLTSMSLAEADRIADQLNDLDRLLGFCPGSDACH